MFTFYIQRRVFLKQQTPTLTGLNCMKKQFKVLLLTLQKDQFIFFVQCVVVSWYNSFENRRDKFLVYVAARLSSTALMGAT